MGGHQDRTSVCFLKKIADDPVLCLFIQAGKRLIENEHITGSQQGAQQGAAPLHPSA